MVRAIWHCIWVFFCLSAGIEGRGAIAEELASVASKYQQQIRPILEQRCFDCHGYGATEGGVSLDIEEAGDPLLTNVDLWNRALRSVRGGLMPPDGAERPTADEVAVLADWIKQEVFRIDYANPDPGSVTLRRLNRDEYRNTIRDLMGIDYNVEILFPPDDTGYGFDNVGDVLSVSPLLIEKYLQAATEIVEQAVPMVALESPRRVLGAGDFRSAEGGHGGWQLNLDVPREVHHEIDLPAPGTYRFEILIDRDGSFDYDPSQAMIGFYCDDQLLLDEQQHWDDNFKLRYERDTQLEAGKHRLTFDVRPLEKAKEDPEAENEFSVVPEDRFACVRIREVRVIGPLGDEHRVAPENFHRYYPQDQPPTDDTARRKYAHDVLEAFCLKAFRRPVDAAVLERLVQVAADSYAREDRTFERGIADAMIAALTSSHFLYRMEAPEFGDNQSSYPLVDQFTLASRLSYFLWRTSPDEQLMTLAAKGELREQLSEQIERLLRDEKARRMMRSFVGQWLRVQDVQHVPLNPLAIHGVEDEYEQLRRELRKRGFRRLPEGESDPVRERFLELREIYVSLDSGIRNAMRREIEEHFEYLVEQDRSLLELIDCDYAFLNQDLAKYYGIEGVEGNHFRRVDLTAESLRGGVLTAGSTLLVTSNPTRTSPVKRGLFVLDNLLGTPPPPPPPNVPELEEVEGDFGDREPTLRELLALHRESPLCSSCHQRMDPLGLAMENFNAMGQWREKEGDVEIDASGRLASGEEFNGLGELKQILTSSRRLDYYRCVTQKLLTFALGRGMEPHDQHTIDSIVDQLETSGGQISVLFRGVINSPAFQRMRIDDPLSSVVP